MTPSKVMLRLFISEGPDAGTVLSGAIQIPTRRKEVVTLSLVPVAVTILVQLQILAKSVRMSSVLFMYTKTKQQGVVCVT